MLVNFQDIYWVLIKIIILKLGKKCFFKHLWDMLL